MKRLLAGVCCAVIGAAAAAVPNSFAPVDDRESFAAVMKRMTRERPVVERRHQELLRERYDLANKPMAGVTMTRGKPVQDGVRVKLPAGSNWEALAAMPPEEIRRKGPRASCRCRTPTTPRAACCFRSRTSTPCASRKPAT